MPKQKHHYELTADPDEIRMLKVEEIINTWRSTGQLWDNEDPSIQKILDEYDELNIKIRPQLSDPLRFFNEDWSDDEIANENNNNPFKTPEEEHHEDDPIP